MMTDEERKIQIALGTLPKRYPFFTCMRNEETGETFNFACTIWAMDDDDAGVKLEQALRKEYPQFADREIAFNLKIDSIRLSEARRVLND